LFKIEFEQLTKYPFHSQRHFSGHCIATVAGWIINHNQNITEGVAISSNTNTTVSLGDMASVLDLHRERNCS
jgi:hypothetical protein